MAVARFHFWAFLCAVVFMTSATASSARAADDNDANLRKKALGLNDVTGDDPIKGEIKALLEDPAGTKKLLGVAMKMAKEKEQPFTYNGALILATAAIQLRDLEAAKVLYGVCADQAGKLQSVQKMLQAYNGTMMVIELLFNQRKYESSSKLSQEFLESLERQGVSRDFQAIVLRQMCKSLAKQGRREEANKIVDNLLKIREQDWRNQQIKGWLLHEAGKEEQSLKSYQAALTYVEKDENLEGEQKTQVENEIKLEMLSPLAKLHKLDEANKTIDGIVEPKEKYRLNLELRADVLQESGDMEGVAKIYEDLLGRVSKDEKLDKKEQTRLEHRYRYVLSSVYVDIDQVKKATDELQYLLKVDPDNPSYNNDLGYLWADHNQNLEQAEKMIRKALDDDRKQRKGGTAEATDEEDKDKAAYLDSMGWVLYKKKDYKGAKKFLLDATKEQDGQHVEIMDHLADTHMALGEKADAVAVWKKALTIDSPSRRDKQRKVEIQKKIKDVEGKTAAAPKKP
jgi:tetratricopeptide (TPR) repeat protein